MPYLESIVIEKFYPTPENLTLIQALWEKTGWGWDNTPGKMTAVFQRSWSCFWAHDSITAVGFLRIISDGLSYGLVVDVMVDPTMQRHTIGTRLMNVAIDHCRASGVHILKLISSEQAIDFYKNLGFSVCTPKSPGMILKL